MKPLKIVFPLFLIMTACFHSLVYANQSHAVYRLSAELQIRQIAEDTFLVTHSFPWPANSLIVRYPSQLIIWVDTPYSDRATEQVWQWIKAELGDERLIEINTGFHNDNLGGNGFLYTKSIAVYGSTSTARLLTTCAEKTRKQLLNLLKKPELKKYYMAYSKANYFPPDHLFDIQPDERIVFFKGLCEIYYPGPSHSKDNLMVYFPDKKLLFGGCAVKSMNSKSLGFTGDADLGPAQN